MDLNEGDKDLYKLRDMIRVFVNDRDWDKFHSPKNLSAALCVEAAELLENFQWLDAGLRDELDDIKFENVRHEIADVFVYLIRLADKLGIDVGAAVEEKMAINCIKYPADKVRGDARKYTDYKDN